MKNGNFLSLTEPDTNYNSIEYQNKINTCRLCGDKIPEGTVNVCNDCTDIELKEYGFICAWCEKEDGLVHRTGLSHGICEYHQNIESVKIDTYITDKKILCNPVVIQQEIFIKKLFGG